MDLRGVASGVPQPPREELRVPEGDRDGIAFRKRTKAASLSRVGDLREDLPAFVEHFTDVSLHHFHAEEFLPMVSPVPAPFVCE